MRKIAFVNNTVEKWMLHSLAYGVMLRVGVGIDVSQCTILYCCLFDMVAPLVCISKTDCFSIQISTINMSSLTYCDFKCQVFSTLIVWICWGFHDRDLVCCVPVAVNMDLMPIIIVTFLIFVSDRLFRVYIVIWRISIPDVFQYISVQC